MHTTESEGGLLKAIAADADRPPQCSVVKGADYNAKHFVLNMYHLLAMFTCASYLNHVSISLFIKWDNGTYLITVPNNNNSSSCT